MLPIVIIISIIIQFFITVIETTYLLHNCEIKIFYEPKLAALDNKSIIIIMLYWRPIFWDSKIESDPQMAIAANLAYFES